MIRARQSQLVKVFKMIFVKEALSKEVCGCIELMALKVGLLRRFSPPASGRAGAMTVGKDAV